MNFKFGLGDEVKTKITGYKGIVRGRSDYLTGCNTYGVQNQKLDKEGNPKKWSWFDEDELVLIKANKIQLIEEPEEYSPTTRKRVGGPLSEDKISKK